jgi:hypothetical protein
MARLDIGSRRDLLRCRPGLVGAVTLRFRYLAVSVAYSLSVGGSGCCLARLAHQDEAVR